MITGIYKITNQVNGKNYIGQAVDIERRWHDHRSKYKNPKNEQHNSLLYKAIKKYGIENFTFEIIEECLKNELDEKEKYWIKYYDSFNSDKGYNLTEGGQNGSHFFKLSPTILKEIIDLLQNSSMSLTEIAKKYNVRNNTITNINQGYNWYDDNLTYPLRPPIKKSIYYCMDCGAQLFDGKAKRCKKCAQIASRKVDRPSKEELKQILIDNNGNFSVVGRLFNVTGNAIKKWCKTYDLPFYSKDYKNLK